MITVGYWCDECRRKYVRYTCKEGLPCGHDKADAIYVECQAFAKSGEAVYMSTEDDSWRVSLWIYPLKDEGRRCYSQLWDYAVRINRSERAVFVGEWLPLQEPKVIRAFDSRWDSHKEPPGWVRITEVDIAHALEILKETRSEESLERKLSERKLVETLPVGAGGFRGLVGEAFCSEAMESFETFLDGFRSMPSGDRVDFKIEADDTEDLDYARLSVFNLSCIKRREQG
ncbi:MAG: hypothetical protein AB1631_29695 [Acidobacteriota bacterium]